MSPLPRLREPCGREWQKKKKKKKKKRTKGKAGVKCITICHAKLLVDC
jgi:hypothetical protein